MTWPSGSAGWTSMAGPLRQALCARLRGARLPAELGLGGGPCRRRAAQDGLDVRRLGHRGLDVVEFGGISYHAVYATTSWVTQVPCRSC